MTLFLRVVLILWLLCGGAEVASAQPGDSPDEPASLLNRSWSLLRDQGFSGSLRLDYFSSNRLLDDESDFTGVAGQFKLLPHLNERLNGKVEVRLSDPSVGKENQNDFTLLEGYANYHFGPSDLRIGKQIVAWGRADGINPTDNLTPHDYNVLLPFEEDQRFGTTALKWDAYLTTEETLTLFLTPFFEPSKIPLPVSSGTLLTETKPASSLENTEGGLKLNKTGESLDWSISYFHGFDLLPDARVVGFVPAGLVLELRHTMIDVFGADMAHNFGKFGFRAEAAYILTADRSGEDPTIKNPYLFYVFGVDRTFMENLNLNLQWVGRSVQNYNDPETISDPILRGVAIQNAIIDNQQDPASYGMTSRISDKWFNETLQGEVLLFINFRRTNAYIRPLITYSFTDQVKGTFGGEIYQGPDDSFFGLLKKNQGVFTEVQYSF